MQPKVYLAGPEVFLPNAVDIGREKKALCEAYGLIGLFPFDNEIVDEVKGRRDRQIFAANVDMMRQADAAILNLTPFRSPSADVGTVFELGYLIGLGKPVFAYTAVASHLRSRVPGAARKKGGDGWIDRSGLLIEDFDNADNLMIDGALGFVGHEIVRVDAGGKLSDLSGFKICLQLASDTLRVDYAA